MSGKFLIIILGIMALTILPAVVILGLYATHWSFWWQMVYMLTIIGELFAIFVMATWAFGHVRSLRFFFASFIFITAPKILFAIVAPLAGWKVGLAVAPLCIMAGIYGFFWGWRHLVVVQAECCSPTLPKAFDGYRILQLSDLHIGSLASHPEFIQRIVETANAQHPDLIVFTGDLVNHLLEEAEPFIDTLAQLHAPDGVLAILGNHDYVDWKNHEKLLSTIRGMGWRLLLNEHILHHRDGDTIAIIGVENIGKSRFYTYGDLSKAMQDLPSGIWSMLLSHDPTHWRREVVGATDIALTLSGHTHAAQMRIGRLSPVVFLYREWGGSYHEGSQMLYVSQGIGGTVPFRFGAWPEINVITLRKT